MLSCKACTPPASGCSTWHAAQQATALGRAKPRVQRVFFPPHHSLVGTGSVRHRKRQQHTPQENRSVQVLRCTPTSIEEPRRSCTSSQGQGAAQRGNCFIETFQCVTGSEWARVSRHPPNNKYAAPQRSGSNKPPHGTLVLSTRAPYPMQPQSSAHLIDTHHRQEAGSHTRMYAPRPVWQTGCTCAHDKRPSSGAQTKAGASLTATWGRHRGQPHPALSGREGVRGERHPAGCMDGH